MTIYDSVFCTVASITLLVSLAPVLGATFVENKAARSVLLLSSVLLIWGGLFIASDVGYRAWQSIPDPPREAFNDAAPSGILIIGWIPAAILVGILYVTISKTVNWVRGSSNQQMPVSKN